MKHYLLPPIPPIEKKNNSRKDTPHMNIGFESAEILLPDFKKTDGRRWSVVACDQFTSEPQYWEETAATVGDAPSTLQMILPEAYLAESEERIPAINAEMRRMLAKVLIPFPNTMIALERRQSDGRIRRGVIGAVDLECIAVGDLASPLYLLCLPFLQSRPSKITFSLP